MIMRYERPPDGGWGWVVTFTAFLAYAISWGIPRGFSVLFQDFQSTFESSNSQTSWITSITGGFVLCGTLPGSAINSAFGSRVTVMIGGVLSCIGMIVISQSTNLWMAYTGSMITGLGCGFAYCSGPSQIGIYFDKNRSLAFSIASIGSPANSTLMPLLFVYLSGLYSWRGALFITAGICLHLTVGGALLRPVSICAGPIKNNQKKKVGSDLSLDQTKLLEEARTDKLIQEAALLSSDKNLNIIDKIRNPEVDRMAFLGAWSKSTRSLHYCKDHCPDLSETIDSSSLPLIFSSDLHNKQHFRSKCEIKVQDNFDKDEELYSMKVVHRNDQNSNHLPVSLLLVPTSPKSIQEIQKPSNSRYQSVLIFIRPYLGLLTQWRFMLYCLIGCLDYQVRLTPASFIVVHAQSQGMSKEQGALLLVIFAVMDTCIRPISGFLTNRIPQDKLRGGIEIFLFGSAEFLMFILNIAAPFASQFWALSLYMSLYGIGNGLNSSWCFCILSRLVPIEHLQHGIGIFHFCCSIGFLSGPPLAGYLADMTGHYYAIFYFSGSVIFVAGVLAWSLFYLTKRYGIRPLVTNEEN